MGHLFVFRLGSNDFGKVGKELISTKMVKKKKKRKKHSMPCVVQNAFPWFMDSLGLSLILGEVALLFLFYR